MDKQIKRIAVVGMGYVGIPIAVLLAEAGYQVTGIQRRSKRSGWKIDWLNEGRCPIGGSEPELPELLKKVVAENRFKVTDDYAAVKDADAVLIDVQTPTDENHVPQYASLREACRDVGMRLTQGTIVIIESTVAPGTTEHLVKPILEKESNLKAGLPGGFGLCFSYERVMVGRLIHNIREYPKIVGGIDEESTRLAAQIYRSIVHNSVSTTDPVTAEVSKTVENAYRDVQIAFANEVAVMCETFGIDVHEVRKLVNGLPNDTTSPGANPVRNMHFPGAGVGGHCLPKDTWLLLQGHKNFAEGVGSFNKGEITPVSILQDARRLNDWMPLHMADLLESALDEAGNDIRKSTIAVLGYAFLENSDDARNTPTVAFLRELEKRGAKYKIHDEYIRTTEEGYSIEPDLEKALLGCDALALMTKHDVYGRLTPQKLKDLLCTPVIVDGRNIFDPEQFSAAGFVYRGIGKGRKRSRIRST